ncbi:hypothetical protein KBY82_07375 [Cyanobium sp. AMD-g]|uniref:hypothetical protein n=1 Tax=Cyanobium sp. AMD-g TaxID=2823699 RepID=UPI0020CDF19D|nr:hypothetical protein [Cyanobium sp. AMD-g]MCP9930599.1 hypothetical protein [Cyanobium sp. AMD-g]
MASTVRISIWWRGHGLPRFALDGRPVSLNRLAETYGLSCDTVLARISRGLPPAQWFLSSAELSKVTKREARKHTASGSAF